MAFSKKEIVRKYKLDFTEEKKYNMIATGIPKLDDVLCGGLKPQSTVLLCSQPGVENTEFALQTLFNRLKAGDHGVYLVNNKLPNSVKALAEEYGWNLEDHQRQGTLAFFDAYSALISMKSGTEYCSNEPQNMQQLSELMPEVLAKLESDNVILVFDALSTLIDSTKNEDEVLAGIKKFINEVRKYNTTSFFLFTEWLYPKSLTNKIKSLFECVIEIKALERKVILQKYFSVTKAPQAFERKDIPFKIIKPGGVCVFVPKVLVTGPYHAGKTSFIHSVSTKAVSVNRMGTTVALDHGHVDYKGFEVDLFGTPGQERFDPILEHLGGESLGVVIVVDSTKPEDFARAKKMVELSNTMDLPVVVVANKANLPHALSVEQIRKKMKLREDIPIIPTTAENLNNIKEGEPCQLKKEDVQKVLDKLLEVVV
jgi:small GTP-binding protein